MMARDKDHAKPTIPDLRFWNHEFGALIVPKAHVSGAYDHDLIRSTT
jgi:hypothetical protein